MGNVQENRRGNVISQVYHQGGWGYHNIQVLLLKGKKVEGVISFTERKATWKSIT